MISGDGWGLNFPQPGKLTRPALEATMLLLDHSGDQLSVTYRIWWNLKLATHVPVYLCCIGLLRRYRCVVAGIRESTLFFTRLRYVCSIFVQFSWKHVSNVSRSPVRIQLLGEPFRARLLTSLMVAVAYVTTMKHAEIRSSFFRLVLRNDVPTEFTIHVRNYVLVLSSCTSSEDMSRNSLQFFLWNVSNIVPDIFFEFLKWIRINRANFAFQCVP